MGFILNILNLPFSFSIENLKFNISNKYITPINNIPIERHFKRSIRISKPLES